MKIVELADSTVINIPEGPIGISCSGGTDSSLLLYILMSNCKDTIHIFTLSNDLKGRSNAIIVPRVIERCIQFTNNNNIIHHSRYAENQTEEDLFDFQRELLKEKKIKTIFSGVTANPPSTVKFKSGSGEASLRDPETYRQESSFDGHFLTPFINKNKKTIARIYQDLGLMETLFPVTRSCEAIGKLEYYGHCGECWWCEERQWGFGRV